MIGPQLAEQLADAASSLVGLRFRLRGRDCRTGLDCLGVIDAAFGKCGLQLAIPVDYEMRGRTLARAMDFAAHAGFHEIKGRALPGDVLMFAVGPEQSHFAIAVSGDEFVHAHAGLRKVVRSPLWPDWQLLGHWRHEAR